MRIVLFLLLLLLIGVGAYGYVQNPEGCKKLGHDLKTDLTAIYGKPAAALSNKIASLWKAHGAVPAVPAAAAAPATSVVPGADATPAASAVPAPPAAAVAPAAATALTAWSRPKVTPSEPDWTWTTPDRIYKEVRIVKIEADCVTISHADGMSLVPIWMLPVDIQKQLNYDPAAAVIAAAQRKKEAPATEPLPEQGQVVAQNLAPRAPARVSETTDYAGAVAQAKRTGQLILLHFTGSDWCYYCKMLEQEVMRTPDFTRFVGTNYILVTLDFPHNTPLPDSLKQQNSTLAQKFSVNGFPTLLVIDSNEKELGRTSGYNPGSGPSAVISELKSFSH